MYDVIVVGGGHAGIEAALVCARLHKKTLLITGDINMMGTLPCNPSIGGPAKGVIVREIDALGGEMGKFADKTTLQVKMLNSSKGPAVRALRAQIDKIIYPRIVKEVVLGQPNLTVIEGYVTKLIKSASKIEGVEIDKDVKEYALAVIVCTGTFLDGKIMIGEKSISGGPQNQKPAINLSENIKDIGIPTYRLKTGTPPRIKKDSIDYSSASIQWGDKEEQSFSFEKTARCDEINEEHPCYLIHTNDTTHKIINENIGRSSLYAGIVEGVGPRYCPSIEDKIVRFSDKNRHQIFLEPESIYLDTMYVQGLSTSLPEDVQEQITQSICGLENAVIDKYAYAIEYDAINATSLYPTLEYKTIEGLYFAGQINGTSGYEEAACQGLMAGINASLKINNAEPFILKRNEAYIGVLIDDLVTKGTKEPYRLLTSRAEFRLLLRHDNADLRLCDYGYNLGLITNTVYQRFVHKRQIIFAEITHLDNTKIYNNQNTQTLLKSFKSAPLKESVFASALLKRTEITYRHIKKILDEDHNLSDEVVQQIEIQIKYRGYINKAYNNVQNFLKAESMAIPENIDYTKIHNLALEAVEKLQQIKPTTIGQAQRISGITPSDITMLLLYLKGRRL